jgi:hypothetical protein
MTDPDRMQPLGPLPDLDFNSDGSTCYVDRETHRDYDMMIMPSARLDRYGRNALRALLDECDNEVAAMRLRDLDLAEHKIDPDRLYDGLDLLGFGRPDDRNDRGWLADIDWVKLGRRLERDRPVIYISVQRLHDLLMADGTPACNCVIDRGPVLPACCPVHGTPCVVCGGLESCVDDCGEVAR